MRCVIAMVGALILAGCATTVPPYGNYLQSRPEVQHKLADEAVKQLSALWPPARTRFALQQPTADAFGEALVKGLRESGYALEEFSPGAALVRGAEGSTVAGESSRPLPLSYVLDAAGEAMLYRLTLKIGAQSLTRPYRLQDDVLVPVGYWVKKE